MLLVWLWLGLMEWCRCGRGVVLLVSVWWSVVLICSGNGMCGSEGQYWCGDGDDRGSEPGGVMWC